MTTDSTRRYDYLRSTQTFLRWLAPLTGWTLEILGLTLFWGQAQKLVEEGHTHFEQVAVAAFALTYVLGFGLAGLILARMMRAGSDLIALLIDNEEAVERTADLMERHLVPALNRLCNTLEDFPRAALSTAAQAPPLEASGVQDAQARQMAIEAIKQAVRREWWDQAYRLAEAYRDQFPTAPEAGGLHHDIAAARTQRATALERQLDAARKARDPDRVIELRDQLTQYKEGTDLEQLDQRTIRWLIGYLQRALINGQGKDTVALAQRIADAFPDSAEGASIRASLPTLRAAAGLCRACGKPYVGDDVACPACLGPH